MSAIDVVGLIVQDALWSALAAVGFAILFNVPARTLPGCALGAAAGHVARTLLIEAGMGFELATLFGATMIGFLGMVFARRWRVPVTMFTISAAITLVPGTFAYRTMLGLLQVATAEPEAAEAALVLAAVNAIKTGLTLGAIAVGIAAPRLLFQRERPVV